MPRVKYIKTKQREIIVFSELFDHSDFRSFNPVSAGFIYIGADGEGCPTCSCHGESVSLKLKSDPEDSVLAKRQILRYGD